MENGKIRGGDGIGIDTIYFTRDVIGVGYSRRRKFQNPKMFHVVCDYENIYLLWKHATLVMAIDKSRQCAGEN